MNFIKTITKSTIIILFREQDFLSNYIYARVKFYSLRLVILLLLHGCLRNPSPFTVFESSQYVLFELNLIPSPHISFQMTSSGVLLTSPGILVGLLGNPFTVFQVGNWKIQLVLTENRARVIESRWTWSGGTTTSKDTWTEIWGDEANAAVENDGAAIKLSKSWSFWDIKQIVLLWFKIWKIEFSYWVLLNVFLHFCFLLNPYSMLNINGVHKTNFLFNNSNMS